jgi:hypothetical protein
MQFMVANGTGCAGSNRPSPNRSAACSHEISSQTGGCETLAGNLYRTGNEASRNRQ